MLFSLVSPDFHCYWTKVVARHVQKWWRKWLLLAAGQGGHILGFGFCFYFSTEGAMTLDHFGDVMSLCDLELSPGFHNCCSDSWVA